MYPYALPRKWVRLLIIACVLLSPALLQGCDTFSETEDSTAIKTSESVPFSSEHAKLRHPELIHNAKKLAPGAAGKAGAVDVNLILAFQEYEADGVTPRILNRYEVTQRILEEYGITRRVLNRYGITRRVLNQYDVTRRILNRYGLTKRVLDKYDIISDTDLVTRYGGQITTALLAEKGVTLNMLQQDGILEEDLNDFNTLSTLLQEQGYTIQDFAAELDDFMQTIRLKVHIADAHMGISIAMENSIFDAFLDEISDDPDIAWIEPDVTIGLSDLGMNSGTWYDKQIVPWSITHIKTPIPSFLEIFSADYLKDQPVHVYVLDSGAMPDSWLDDLSYVEKKDFTMLFENPDQLEWEEDLAPDVSGFDPGDEGNPYDESGHGTHVAGTIGAHNDLIGVVGVAPSVRIHSLKVLTREGRTDVTTLLAAVDYITRAKRANPDWPIVVNLSLGMDIGTTSYNVLDEAVEAAIEEGIIFVAAAGNDGQDASTYSPAHVDKVITVGSHNAQNQLSSFSNYGPVVDIFAPGENIVSLSHILTEVKSFETILTSGTSHAAPHVTGAIARYLGSHPNATADEVATALLEAAELVETPTGTSTKALSLERLLPKKKAKSSSSWRWGSGDNDRDDDDDDDDRDDDDD